MKRKQDVYYFFTKFYLRNKQSIVCLSVCFPRPCYHQFTVPSRSSQPTEVALFYSICCRDTFVVRCSGEEWTVCQRIKHLVSIRVDATYNHLVSISPEQGNTTGILGYHGPYTIFVRPVYIKWNLTPPSLTISLVNVPIINLAFCTTIPNTTASTT